MFPSLIKPSKTHFHNLHIGASIILGTNGFIWICPIIDSSEDSVGGFIQNLDEVCLAKRHILAAIWLTCPILFLLGGVATGTRNYRPITKLHFGFNAKQNDVVRYQYFVCV